MIPAEVLEKIETLGNDNIDKVFESLGIEVSGYGEELRSKCPIHDNADNPSGFCYSTRKRKWWCFTNHCEKGNPYLVGLVIKLLSKKEHREVKLDEAVFWLAALLNFSIENATSNIKPQSIDDVEISRFVKETKYRQPREENPKKSSSYGFPVSILKGRPVSERFLKMGFSREILEKYHVGFCNNPNKILYNRSVVPILEPSGKIVIGATGRTAFEVCNYCGAYHNGNAGCPVDNPKVKAVSKWYHENFNTSEVLFNEWFAKEHIIASKIAVCVEGPKDCLRLVDNKVDNVVALFGLRVLKPHLIKLIQMGVTKLVLCLDNDEKGIEASKEITGNLSNYFKIENIQPMLKDYKDIAEVPKEEIGNIVKYFNV